MLVLIHVGLCLYVFPLFYFIFCLKSSTNINLKIKRDNELQKPSHILVFNYEKGKTTCNENVWCQKAKNLFIKLKYQKFQASISKWDVLIQKWSNVINCKEAKWKTSKICNHFLIGGHICSFYNWDRPLDLVLVVYDLIELIIEISL